MLFFCFHVTENPMLKIRSWTVTMEFLIFFNVFLTKTIFLISGLRILKLNLNHFFFDKFKRLSRSSIRLLVFGSLFPGVRPGISSERNGKMKTKWEGRFFSKKPKNTVR